MNTNSTASTFRQESVSSESPTPEPFIFGDIVVTVLSFVYSTKPGSSYKGSAKVEIRGLVPGHIVGFAKIGYFSAFDEQDPDDKGKCRFSNFKNEQDEWEPSIWFRAEDSDNKALNYRLLAKIRKVVEAYLVQQENPTAQFDEIPQNVPIDDKDIPF